MTGDPVLRDGRPVGRVGTVVLHHELGPVALALVKRSVPVDAELVAGRRRPGRPGPIDPDSIPPEDRAPPPGRAAQLRTRPAPDDSALHRPTRCSSDHLAEPSQLLRRRTRRLRGRDLFTWWEGLPGGWDRGVECRGGCGVPVPVGGAGRGHRRAGRHRRLLPRAGRGHPGPARALRAQPGRGRRADRRHLGRPGRHPDRLGRRGRPVRRARGDGHRPARRGGLRWPARRWSPTRSRPAPCSRWPARAGPASTRPAGGPC